MSSSPLGFKSWHEEEKEEGRRQGKSGTVKSMIKHQIHTAGARFMPLYTLCNEIDFWKKNTNVKVRADREWVYLTVDLRIVDCTCEGRHICSELKEEPIEGVRVCMHLWNWCITTRDTHTHTQMHHAPVCARGENIITHHVDWALGRSLFRRQSGENRSNEQVTHRERYRK